jgi:hypothetical protein
MAEDNDPGASAGTTGGGTATDTLFNIARGAKAIALLCFVLPFVTVSCAGQPLARITGVQLSTGSVPPIGANAPGAPGAPAGGGGGAGQGYSLDIFALGAALLIIAGLVVTFMMVRRRAALVAMVCSAVAALLLVFDVFVRIKGAAEDQIRSGSANAGSAGPTGAGAEFEQQMRQQMEQMAQQISVDPAIGFWLCIVALIAAIVLDNMVRSKRADL